jgi:hypothetical protein
VCLGRTPKSRVKWALKFRLLDLIKLSERDRHRAWAMLVEWQRGRPEQGPRPAKDKVLEAQQTLRQCIEALANGEGDFVHMPEIRWAIFLAQRRARVPAVAASHDDHRLCQPERGPGRF